MVNISFFFHVAWPWIINIGLNTDTINAQLRAQLEQSAYDRAGDMYNLTKKKGSGRKKTTLYDMMKEISFGTGITSNYNQNIASYLETREGIMDMIGRGYTLAEIEEARNKAKAYVQ